MSAEMNQIIDLLEVKSRLAVEFQEVFKKTS